MAHYKEIVDNLEGIDEKEPITVDGSIRNSRVRSSGEINVGSGIYDCNNEEKYVMGQRIDCTDITRSLVSGAEGILSRGLVTGSTLIVLNGDIHVNRLNGNSKVIIGYNNDTRVKWKKENNSYMEKIQTCQSILGKKQRILKTRSDLVSKQLKVERLNLNDPDLVERIKEKRKAVPSFDENFLQLMQVNSEINEFYNSIRYNGELSKGIAANLRRTGRLFVHEKIGQGVELDISGSSIVIPYEKSPEEGHILMYLNEKGTVLRKEVPIKS
ncbi:MAG: hypothetical protein Q8O84_01265 [Nanoarchaeota archaeon]|nr:hypothetical protein [Nanoarchaeota archaeon]